MYTQLGKYAVFGADDPDAPEGDYGTAVPQFLSESSSDTIDDAIDIGEDDWLGDSFPDSEVSEVQLHLLDCHYSQLDQTPIPFGSDIAIDVSRHRPSLPPTFEVRPDDSILDGFFSLVEDAPGLDSTVSGVPPCFWQFSFSHNQTRILEEPGWDGKPLLPVPRTLAHWQSLIPFGIGHLSDCGEAPNPRVPPLADTQQNFLADSVRLRRVLTSYRRLAIQALVGFTSPGSSLSARDLDTLRPHVRELLEKRTEQSKEKVLVRILREILPNIFTGMESFQNPTVTSEVTEVLTPRVSSKQNRYLYGLANTLVDGRLIPLLISYPIISRSSSSGFYWTTKLFAKSLALNLQSQFSVSRDRFSRVFWQYHRGRSKNRPSRQHYQALAYLSRVLYSSFRSPSAVRPRADQNLLGTALSASLSQEIPPK
jgi:hypothetical protein